MKRYKPLFDRTITETAHKMVRMANESGEPVVADFNCVEITANPGDDAKAIEKYYYDFGKGKRTYRLARHTAAQRRQEPELNRALAEAPEMTVRNEKLWKEWEEASTDPYVNAVIRYAERWARLMEAKMANGDTLEDCAKETSHLADNEGITISMYVDAVRILHHVWIHGEELRRWHNLDVDTQMGSEANQNGTILVPPLITLSIEG